MDLLNDKWYKSKYDIPDGVVDEERNNICYAIKNHKIADVHSLNFANRAHFIVNSHDLVSKEFINSRRDHYHPLTMGYFKGFEKQGSIPNMPFVLKQLILNIFL